MNMDINSAITKCTERMRSRFRGCHVEINPTPDDSTFYEAVVYGVEEDAVDQVAHFIHELDYQVFRPAGSLLIPMVVDAEDTRNYYPEVSLILSHARLQSALQQVMPVLTGLDYGKYLPDWNFASHRHDDVMTACDAELALAA